MLEAPPGTYEAVAEVCGEYFGSEFVGEHLHMFYPAWFLDVEQAHVADKAEQTEKVAAIEKSLRTALSSLYALHPDVRRSVEWQVRDNLRTDKPIVRIQTFTEIEGQETPFSSSDNLELYLRTALAAFVGIPSNTPDILSTMGRPARSAKASAHNMMSDLNMKSLTPKARDHETWQKALTVRRCREIWSLAKHEPAPKNSPDGQFGKFLGDIVEAVGKIDKWKSVQATMRAWQRCSEQNGWFLGGN